MVGLENPTYGEGRKKTGTAMRTFRRCILLGVLLGAGLPFALLAAQNPAGADKGKGEKLIELEMRDKPWATVIEWLADQADLPSSGTLKPPAGSFNFITKPGTKSSLPDAIDQI